MGKFKDKMKKLMSFDGMFILAVLYSGTDAILTAFAMAGDLGKEANPIVSALMPNIGKFLTLVFLWIATLICLSILYKSHEKSKYRNVSYFFVAAIAFERCAISCWNATVIIFAFL